MISYSDIFAFIAGIIMTLSVGYLSSIILEKVSSEIIGSIPAPWNSLFSSFHTTGGKWIGRIERIIFFTGFWMDRFEVVPVILTFKIAAKWESWKNIVQVSKDPPKKSPEDHPNEETYFTARSLYASYVLTRFLWGTFSNIAAGAGGLGAAYITKYIVKDLKTELPTLSSILLLILLFILVFSLGYCFGNPKPKKEKHK